MGSYSVTINIDNSWVENFNANGFQLLMAKATQDGSGNTVYNVVAYSSPVTPQMEANWTDSYEITGTTQSFSPGNSVEISGISGLAKVNFGETYKLKDWGSFSVAADPNAPSNGFGFQNDVPASVLVEFEMGNSYIPVYMSPSELPPGMDKLIPLPQVAFWFQQSLTTGTMISLDMSDVIVVDLSGGPTATISYSAQGVWSRVSAAKTSGKQKAIDYTKVKPART